MKKIGSCQILRKFAANAYEIELSNNVRISPIFNVADLYPYRKDEIGGSDDQKEIIWEKQIPVENNPKMVKIIDNRIDKRTGRKNYFEYLVEWKGYPEEYDRWVSETDILKKGKTVKEIMGGIP